MRKKILIAATTILLATGCTQQVTSSSPLSSSSTTTTSNDSTSVSAITSEDNGTATVKISKNTVLPQQIDISHPKTSTFNTHTVI